MNRTLVFHCGFQRLSPGTHILIQGHSDHPGMDPLRWTREALVRGEKGVRVRSATTSGPAGVWFLANNSSQAEVPCQSVTGADDSSPNYFIIFCHSTEQFVFTILYMVLLLPLIVTIPAILRSLQGLGQVESCFSWFPLREEGGRRGREEELGGESIQPASTHNCSDEW